MDDFDTAKLPFYSILYRMFDESVYTLDDLNPLSLTQDHVLLPHFPSSLQLHISYIYI